MSRHVATYLFSVVFASYSFVAGAQSLTNEAIGLRAPETPETRWFHVAFSEEASLLISGFLNGKASDPVNSKQIDCDWQSNWDGDPIGYGCAFDIEKTGTIVDYGPKNGYLNATGSLPISVSVQKSRRDRLSLQLGGKGVTAIVNWLSDGKNPDVLSKGNLLCSKQHDASYSCWLMLNRQGEFQ